MNLWKHLIPCIGSLITAWSMMLLLMPRMIRFLKQWGYRRVSDDRQPETHRKKTGTPAMGGVGMHMVCIGASLGWGQWTGLMGILLGTLASFGGLGLWDDALKIRAHRGMRAGYKFLAQLVCAVVVIIALYRYDASIFDTMYVPWGGVFYLPVWIGLGIAPFFVVGLSNAVNLTDGVDGLALSTVLPLLVALGILVYGSYPAHTQTLAVVIAGLVGSGLGLLLFNRYPARIFMGDVGSLGLGALIAVVALILHQALGVLLMGSVLLMETASVVLQVGYYKQTGRRLFRMAPIHHHFERLGWHETRIVSVAFWVTVCLTSLTLGAWWLGQS